MIQFESRDDNNLLLLNNKNNFELNKNGHYVIHVNAYQVRLYSKKEFKKLMIYKNNFKTALRKWI